MRILVRLPNWLGDVMMSFAFIQKLQQSFISSEIELIVKKGLEEIIQYFFPLNKIHVFNKTKYKGIKGALKFANLLSAQSKYDLFISLPESFSSAVMAFGTGAKYRVGYKNEFRSFLLTHSYAKPKNLHRTEEYCALIDLYLNKKISFSDTYKYEEKNRVNKESEGNYIVVNFNSEAISRRMPVEKSVQLLEMLQHKFTQSIKLIGGANDKQYIDKIYSLLVLKQNIENIAGNTSLLQLINLMKDAFLVISTDSGPAQIALIFGTPLIVIFSAGNEKNTGPYKNKKAIVVRNARLPCEPCVKNACKLAPLPVCLTKLDLIKVINSVDALELPSA